MRRELARSESTRSVLVRARILEEIPALFPDVSDLASEPTCAPDLVTRLREKTLGHRPIEFSRMLVARIRAAGRVGDTTDVMPEKAAFLIALARLKDCDLTRYRPAPEERGPPPPKSLVHYLALGYLASSNLFVNVATAHRFLLEQLRTSKDDRDIALLVDVGYEYLESAAWGHPRRLAHNGARALLRSWLPDLRRRLFRADSGTRGRLSVEIALARLQALGTYARRAGVGDRVDKVVDEIIAAGGRVPLARGIPGAPRRLLEVASAAKYDVDTNTDRVGADTWLPARPPLYNVWRDWLSREPAGGRPAAAAARARLRELEAELHRLHHAAPRCAVLEGIPRWVAPGGANRRFEMLLRPMFTGKRIHLSSETLCRIAAAFDVKGVDATRRDAMLLRLLSAKPDQISEYDLSADEAGPGIGYDTSRLQIRGAAARALSAHPGWIDDSPALRRWLSAAARAPLEGTGANAMADHGQAQVTLEPAYEHLLVFDAKGGVGSARFANGQGILRSWIASIRSVLQTDLTGMDPGEAAMMRTRALGEFAGRYRLRAQAKRVFEDILGKKGASPIRVRNPSEARAAARAAAVATAVLADSKSE